MSLRILQKKSYIHVDDVLAAIRLADEKLRVNSRDSRILAFRSTYLAMSDRKSEAIASLQKALSFTSNDSNVQFRAAIVYNHFLETDRALDALRKAAAAGFPFKLHSGDTGF